MYEVLVKRLGGLRLHRKGEVRLTIRLDMTIVITVDVKQYQNNYLNFHAASLTLTRVGRKILRN